VSVTFVWAAVVANARRNKGKVVMFPDETVAEILANNGAFWLESFTRWGKYLG
jgi:hypothetical protein